MIDGIEMKNETKQAITVVFVTEDADAETVAGLKDKFNVISAEHMDEVQEGELALKLDADGLALVSDGQELRGDFTRMLPRLKNNNLPKELLVRAAKIKDASGTLTAIDATAGLGEDSLLLAAAGFHVKMYERNPIIYELLYDAWKRAVKVPELAEIVSRMEIFHDDSMNVMKNLDITPDVILLDPMFPARQKSSLVKKKLQMIQKLEIPCMDEGELMLTAIHAKPKKLIVKRPPKGPYLAGIKPDFSNEGKAVRFDCIVSPYDRVQKFEHEILK